MNTLKKRILIISLIVLLAGMFFVFPACSCSSCDTGTESDYITVTFDLNGAEGENEVLTIREGDRVFAPEPSPTRERFVFSGWSEKSDELVPWVFTTTIYENLTLYAYWVRLAPQLNIVAQTIHYNLLLDGEDIDLTRFFTVNDFGLIDYTITITGEGVAGTTLPVPNADGEYAITISLTGDFDTVSADVTIIVYRRMIANIFLHWSAFFLFDSSGYYSASFNSFVTDIEYIDIFEEDVEILFFINNERKSLTEVTLLPVGQHHIKIDIVHDSGRVVMIREFLTNVSSEDAGFVTITQTVFQHTIVGLPPHRIDITDFISYTPSTAGEIIFVAFRDGVRQTNARQLSVSVGTNDFVIQARLEATGRILAEEAVSIEVFS